MPSRTFHHKTRHGCLGCKQRRKRCDQRLPTCSGCARRRITCVYDQVLGTVAATNLFNRSIIRPLSTEWDEPSVKAILSLEIPHVGFNDIEMIYLFRTRDPTTLDTIPGVFGVRRSNLVKIIPDYPYLLYGLITAAALHSKSYTSGDNDSGGRSLEKTASKFYQLSLSAYRSRLDVIDEKTCGSIFAFSVTLASLTFGMILSEQVLYHEYCQGDVNGIIGIFNLLLGAVAIANQPGCLISVKDNPLMLPSRASLAYLHDSVEGEVRNILDSLPSRIHTAHSLARNQQTGLVDISAVYEFAIPELRNKFFCLQIPGPNSLLSVFSWAAYVGRPFVSLLVQRHPAALVVLAHYAVALHALNRVWWLRTVGAKLIRSIAQVITGRHGEEWRALLRWPIEKIGSLDLGTSKTRAAQMYQSHCVNNEALDSGNACPFELSLAITQTVGIIDPDRDASSHLAEAV